MLTAELEIESIKNGRIDQTIVVKYNEYAIFQFYIPTDMLTWSDCDALSNYDYHVRLSDHISISRIGSNVMFTVSTPGSLAYVTTTFPVFLIAPLFVQIAKNIR